MTSGKPPYAPASVPEPSDGANSAPAVRQDRIQQDRYRVLIEDVADGYYETDLRGNFKFFNDALCRIFDRERHEIQDHSYREFMDAENAQIAYEAFNRIYRTEQGGVDISWAIRRRDGEQRYLEISANLITDDPGKRSGSGDSAGCHRQIPGPKSAERFRTVCPGSFPIQPTSRAALSSLSQIPAGPVFAFHLDSTVSYLNPAFEKVFGWTLEELEGRKIPFVPDLPKSRREGIQRLFREKVIHGFETKRLTKDGRLLDIIIDGAIFYDEDNQPAGQIITLRDVTQEKRTARINQALFRIAKALYRYRSLDERLQFYQRGPGTPRGGRGHGDPSGPGKQGVFFREAALRISKPAEKSRRFVSGGQGVAGYVYRTGKPLMVRHIRSPDFFHRWISNPGIKLATCWMCPSKSKTA